MNKQRIEDILQYSDGAYTGEDQVFTTMRVSDHYVYFWQEHLKRVVANLEYLWKWEKGNTTLFPSDFLAKKIPDYLEEQIKNRIPSSGEWRVRIGFYRKDEKYHFFFTVVKCDAPFGEHPPHKLICLVKDDEALRPTLLKSGTYKNTLQLKQEMAERGYSEIVFVDKDNHVLEAGTSNIFLLLNDNQVITPPLRRGVLTGTCRENLISFFKSNNIEVYEREISKQEIVPNEKNSLVLTNAVWGIQTVEELEQMKFRMSPFWHKIIKKFHNEMSKI